MCFSTLKVVTSSLRGRLEGFARDLNSRLVGVDTGKPCLLLEDLAWAVPPFPPQGDTSNTISVSIDPTQEGLWADAIDAAATWIHIVNERCTRGC